MRKHPWNVSIEEARRIQEHIKKYLIIQDMIKDIKTVGGVDVSYGKSTDKTACCVISVFTYPDLMILSSASSKGKVNFPYIPGLFAFREGPLIEQTFLLLKVRPDILLFDGQGICHPSGIGIASHLGVYLDVPSIGCAKSNLAGVFTEPGPLRGCRSPISIGNIQVGYVLRTKDNVKPIFVSPGHKAGLQSAADICLQCTKNFRIPEPIRHAHIQSQSMLTHAIA